MRRNRMVSRIFSWALICGVTGVNIGNAQECIVCEDGYPTVKLKLGRDELDIYFDVTDEEGKKKKKSPTLKLLPGKDYLVTVDAQKELAGCWISTVESICGVEFKVENHNTGAYRTHPNYDGENTWWSSDSLRIFDYHEGGEAVGDVLLTPETFSIRIVEPKSDQADSGGEDRSQVLSSSPNYIVGDSGPELVPPGITFRFEGGSVGLGTDGSAPYRNGGTLSWGGSISSDLAKPARIKFSSIEEVQAKAATDSFPGRPAKVNYTEQMVSPGGPKEMHLVTPSRLLRVTGYNGTSHEVGVDHTTANATYIREYVRNSASETQSVTLGRSPISWYRVSPMATGNGISLKKSVQGIESETSYSAESLYSLSVNNGKEVVSTAVSPLTGGGNAYTTQKIVTNNSKVTSKVEEDFSLIENEFKIQESRNYINPTGTGPANLLTTAYGYYLGAGIPTGITEGSLRWVSYPDGNWEYYRYHSAGADRYSPFSSESTLNTSEGDMSKFPINLHGEGRLRLTKLYNTGASRTFIIFDWNNLSNEEAILENAIIENEFNVYENDKGRFIGRPVDQQDAIEPVGIGLIAKSGNVYFDYRISENDENLWLAEKPVIISGSYGQVRFYQYEKSGSISKETITTGVLSDSGTNAQKIGKIDGLIDKYFVVKPSVSERVINTYDSHGKLIKKDQFYHTGSDFSNAYEETYLYDSYGEITSVSRNGTQIRWIERPNGTTIETDERGREITTVRNSIGDIVSSKIIGGGGVGEITTSYEVDGLTRTTRVNGEVTEILVYDGLGRSSSIWNKGGTTYLHYPYGGRNKEMILPGGRIIYYEHYLDGKLRSISGDVVHEFRTYNMSYLEAFNEGLQEYYAYDITNEETRSIGSSSGHTDRKTFVGTKDRKTYQAYLGFSGERVTEFSNDNGTRRSFDGTSGIGDQSEITIVQDQPFQNEIYRGKDLNNDGVLTFGVDRFTKETWSYVQEGSTIYRKTEISEYPDGTEANPRTTESVQQLSFTSAGSGKYSTMSSRRDPSGRTYSVTHVIDRANSKVVTTEDDSATTGFDQISTSVNGYLESVQHLGEDQKEIYGYDGKGRLVWMTDRNGKSLRYQYDSQDRVSRQIDQVGQVTQYFYYSNDHLNSGLLHRIIEPGGRETQYRYNNRGQVIKITGNSQYAQLFDYDNFGDKISLTTTKSQLDDFSDDEARMNGTSAYKELRSTTQWHYQESTGLLTAKRYHGGGNSGYSYEYTDDGKISKRTSARGIETIYGYNSSSRDLESVTYSGDSNSTPDITFSGHDYLGRPTTVTETLGGHTQSQTLTYKPSGVVSTDYSGSHTWLPGISVSREDDDLLGRPTGFQLKSGSTSLSTQTYQYDTLSRVKEISSADLTADLFYDGGSGTLIGQTVKSGAQVAHERRMKLDAVGRIERVTNRAPGSGLGSPLVTVGSIEHRYDDAGRRKNAVREDGTRWEYGYNSRSEVESAVKKNAGGSILPGLEFTYAYDGIGNRTSATVGSHGHIADLGYTANGLNQYTSVSHSGKFWSLVRSDAGVITATSADSTVNGMTQVGNIHGAKISVNTDNNGRFISNAFMRDGNPVPGSVQTWVPPYSFAPLYDLDGNLTNDGRWSYTWDGENRLLSMIPSISSVTMGVPNVEVYFAYDYGSRRVGKRIVDKRHTPAQTKIISYAYDDWNPVATWERSSFASAPVLKQTYLWGIDVGSSGNAGFGGRLQLQQAGGVGGLVSSTHYNSPSSKEHYVPSYDANGNIITWSGGTGALLRKVDYDAFGNEVLVEDFGVTTKLPEFGFSTKIKDAETGLSYYGYRYYDPKTGRWPSRDPVEEKGGINLYGFVENNGINSADVLGLYSWEEYGSLGVTATVSPYPIYLTLGGKITYSEDTSGTCCKKVNISGDITYGGGGSVRWSGKVGVWKGRFTIGIKGTFSLAEVSHRINADIIFDCLDRRNNSITGEIALINATLGMKADLGANFAFQLGNLKYGFEEASVTGNFKGDIKSWIAVDMDRRNAKLKARAMLNFGAVVTWNGQDIFNHNILENIDTGEQELYSYSW